jgi:hypothetical protein
MTRMVFQGLAVVAGMLLCTGCASDKHEAKSATAGQITVCTKCYDEIKQVQGSVPRSGPERTYTIRTHRCEDCKADMAIYMDDGTMKVRCPTCAPAGVACDRCVPKSGVK